MFTGLVRGKGAVKAVESAPEGRRLQVEVELAEADYPLGASVAIAGVCLTVVASEAVPGAGSGRVVLSFEAAFETLDKTTLGGLSAGAAVNYEPSLRLGDALGGHLVSGHVDGVGKLARSARRGDAWEYWFQAPGPLMRFVAPKGSICIDGVSLTVNAVDGNTFMVGLVPHTLEVTSLSALEPGDAVNLEVDQLARYVVRAMEFDREDPGRTNDD